MRVIKCDFLRSAVPEVVFWVLNTFDDACVHFKNSVSYSAQNHEMHAFKLNIRCIKINHRDLIQNMDEQIYVYRLVS